MGPGATPSADAAPSAATPRSTSTSSATASPRAGGVAARSSSNNAPPPSVAGGGITNADVPVTASTANGPGIVPTIAKKSKGGRKAANPTMSDEERRQERVLKNRVSAMKSLQKKKRYTDDLEKRAKLLTAQNIDLKSRIYTLVAKLNPAIHGHNHHYDALLQSLLVQQQQQQHGHNQAYAYHNNNNSTSNIPGINMPNIPAVVQHQHHHQQIIDAQHRQAIAVAAAQRQAVISSQLFSAPGATTPATAVSSDSLPTSPLLLDEDARAGIDSVPIPGIDENNQVQIKKEEEQEIDHIPIDSFDTLSLPTVPPAPPDVPSGHGLIEVGHLNNLSHLDVDIGHSFLNVSADAPDLSLLDDMPFDSVHVEASTV